MCVDVYKDERCLIMDESGNLGCSGRYFVIACIDTTSYKALHNIMHSKIGLARKEFPSCVKAHTHELKANDAYPCVKYYILEHIVNKDIKISYIVLDKLWADPALMRDKNIMYNYLCKVLFTRLISKEDSKTRINILYDIHTVKITSKDSFSDYIKTVFNYDFRYDIDFNIKALDSDSSDGYVIQAADYVANAIYARYEDSNNSLYFDLIKHKMAVQEQFPYKKFGTDA